MIYLLFGIMAYLFGNISPSILVGKVTKGIDIREINSKNAGTSNVTMTIGWRWGIFVLLMDMLKGFIPVLMVRLLYPQMELLWFFTGFAVIMGHIYPVFYSFKGGKGSATYGGTLFAITPLYAFIMLIAYFVILLIFDYIVLSTLAVSIVTPIVYYFMGFKIESIIFLILFAIVSIVKHKENYLRLFKGEEVGLRKFNKHKDKIRV